MSATLVKFYHAQSHMGSEHYSTLFCVVQVTQMFKHDVNLADRLYIIDTQLAASPDMKALKHALGAQKKEIVAVSFIFLQLFPKKTVCMYP